MTSTDLLVSLPDRLPQLRTITLAMYSPRPGVEQRVCAIAPPGVLKSVEKLKAVDPLVFEQVEGLESILLAAYGTPQPVLFEMQSHDYAPEQRNELTIPVENISIGAIQKTVRELPEGHVLGLASICALEDGSEGHLPLLDFRLPISEGNVRLVRAAAESLGLEHGAICASGRSYHVYGFIVLSVEQWRDLMTRALLLAPLVDTRFIAHRMLAKRGVLRVSTCREKPTEPTVVELF
jgi:hypothetical protein